MINSKYTIIPCYINKLLYAVNLRNESSFFATFLGVKKNKSLRISCHSSKTKTKIYNVHLSFSEHPEFIAFLT